MITQWICGLCRVNVSGETCCPKCSRNRKGEYPMPAIDLGPAPLFSPEVGRWMRESADAVNRRSGIFERLWRKP